MYRYSGIILEFLWVVDINYLLSIEEKIIFHSQKWIYPYFYWWIVLWRYRKIRKINIKPILYER